MIRMKRNRFSVSMVFLAALALLLGGCMMGAPNHWDKSAGMQQKSISVDKGFDEIPPEKANSQELTDPDRHYVRTGRVDLAVDAIEPAMRSIHDLTKKQGGYVEALQTKSLTIRIPAAQFQAVLDALPAIGTIVEKHIQIVDVTDAYADSEAELANLHALKTRLKALLAKATTVKETLDIERELVRVQTKIDQLTGRLARMKKQVAYAKLHIRLAERTDETETSTLRAAWWLQEIGLSNLFQ